MIDLLLDFWLDIDVATLSLIEPSHIRKRIILSDPNRSVRVFRTRIPDRILSISCLQIFSLSLDLTMGPKKILIIAGDFVEDYEIMVPYQALLMVGHHVDVVCPDKNAKDTIATCVHDFESEQTYSEKRGHNFVLTATFSSVDSKNYDGLIVPGGRAPEYIRLNKRVLELVREFDNDRKPIASICHGLQVLITAGVVNGKRVTSYKAIGPDLELAGAKYTEVEATEVVVDGHIVTSPAWPGHPKWLAEFLKLLGTIIQL